jgi:rubrerythrin
LGSHFTTRKLLAGIANPDYSNYILTEDIRQLDIIVSKIFLKLGEELTMAARECLILKDLQMAIQMEKDGKKFYEDAAQKAKSDGTKEIFTYLAKGEVYHIQRIEEIYGALQKNPSWTEAMCEFSPPQEDPKIFSAALAKGNMGTGDADDLKALDIGLKMEQQSIDFYQRLAKQAQDPMERRFLLSLVNEERGHYYYLVDYRNYLVDPADWYYIKEMGNVDGA